MRALSINVYKCSHGDCSNGGLSSKFNKLLLICEDGNVEVDITNPPENLVKIVIRRIGGEEYKHIEPYAPVKEGSVGWMSGGALAYCCDGRFGRLSRYPLSLHDRQETTEKYEKLSK